MTPLVVWPDWSVTATGVPTRARMGMPRNDWVVTERSTVSPVSRSSVASAARASRLDSSRIDPNVGRPASSSPRRGARSTVEVHTTGQRGVDGTARAMGQVCRGNEPMWARKSGELFYRRGDAMMVIGITTTPAVTVGKLRRLFEKAYNRTGSTS